MQSGTVTSHKASVHSEWLLPLHRDTRQSHQHARKRGRGRFPSPDLRLDPRTLQLWRGFGAHVSQPGWITLQAESRELLLQSVMKGLFAYAVLFLRACLCHNFININFLVSELNSLRSWLKQPKKCSVDPLQITWPHTHTYNLIFILRIWFLH